MNSFIQTIKIASHKRYNKQVYLSIAREVLRAQFTDSDLILCSVNERTNERLLRGTPLIIGTFKHVHTNSPLLLVRLVDCLI